MSRLNSFCVTWEIILRDFLLVDILRGRAKSSRCPYSHDLKSDFHGSCGRNPCWSENQPKARHADVAARWIAAGAAFVLLGSYLILERIFPNPISPEAVGSGVWP